MMRLLQLFLLVATATADVLVRQKIADMTWTDAQRHSEEANANVNRMTMTLCGQAYTVTGSVGMEPEAGNANLMVSTIKGSAFDAGRVEVSVYRHVTSDVIESIIIMGYGPSETFPGTTWRCNHDSIIELDSDGLTGYTCAIDNAEGPCDFGVHYNHEFLVDFGTMEFSTDSTGTVGYVTGEGGTGTISRFDRFLKQYPIETLELQNIPGSLGETNPYVGRMIRDHGLSTKVTSTSNIQKGGTDLFLAGVKRYMQQGAQIGVHEWCCTAADSPTLPKEDQQQNYFTEMLGEEDGRNFYTFTMQAHAMYKMTMDEMTQYNVVTDII